MYEQIKINEYLENLQLFLFHRCSPGHTLAHSVARISTSSDRRADSSRVSTSRTYTPVPAFYIHVHVYVQEVYKLHNSRAGANERKVPRIATSTRAGVRNRKRGNRHAEARPEEDTEKGM